MYLKTLPFLLTNSSSLHAKQTFALYSDPWINKCTLVPILFSWKYISTFKLYQDQLVRTVPQKNVWVISKLYNDVLHINIWDEFNVDLYVTFQTRLRSPCWFHQTFRNTWISSKLSWDSPNLYLRNVWCWPCCDVCHLSNWVKVNLPCQLNPFKECLDDFKILNGVLQINISEIFNVDISVTFVTF